MVLPSGVRRLIPSGRAMKVPLLDPHPMGQWLQGLIRVPTPWSEAPQHTNDFYKLQEKILEDVKKWVAYRESRGWRITTKPEISGPYLPETESPKDEDNPDERWYWVIARFSRITPAYISLEDHSYLMEQAKRFKIDIEKDTPPWNTPEDYDSGWVDPLEFREEWYKKYPKD